MFQISRRADYAVRIVLELGLAPAGQLLNARFIARQTAVPQPFLHKITADLIEAGLVRSQVGPGGGLALARPAEQINMRHILEAVEGPVCLNTCLLRPGECPRDRHCPAHGFWGHLQQMIVQQLNESTLDRLLDQARALQKRPSRQSPVYLYQP